MVLEKTFENSLDRKEIKTVNRKKKNKNKNKNNNVEYSLEGLMLTSADIILYDATTNSGKFFKRWEYQTT